MMDYIKAALYTVLFFAVVFGLAGALTAFPGVTVAILIVALTGLLYHTFLAALRSHRKLDEIRARYE